MKFVWKMILSIGIFGLILISSFGLFFYYNSRNRHEADIISNIELNIGILSQQVRQKLINEIEKAAIIGNSPLLKEALQVSNQNYDQINNTDRQKLIEFQNEHWMASDQDDPFVREILTTPVSGYLSSIQMNLPGHYGELFLTNRYGAVIGSTSKLTTFAHSHKYWWQGGFNEGLGRPFIDDRGFDSSVGGYVLGIVVPVYDNGELLGILKCNINLVPFFSALLDYAEVMGKDWDMMVTRSNGQIAFAEGVEPLSTTVPEEILSLLSTQSHIEPSFSYKTARYFYILSTIDSTVYDEDFMFGGSPRSIDHEKGNQGDHWDFIARIEKTAMYSQSRVLLTQTIEVGFLFLLAVLLFAFLFSRNMTRNLHGFIPILEHIGKGNLDSKLPETANDEIGTFAKSFNQMLANLEETLITNENLKKLVEEKEYLMKELNHRTKNNLLLVTSLIRMKEASMKGTVDFQDLIQRIEAVTIVHEKLYNSDDVKRIKLRDYISDLLGTINRLSIRPFQIDTDIIDEALPTTQIVPIGLIINEIATNALKHGFSSNGGKVPKLSLEIIREDEAKNIVLRMSNNGEPFPADTSLNNPSTLGLRLISALTGQLDGTIELQRKPHPVFTIQFPAEVK